MAPPLPKTAFPLSSLFARKSKAHQAAELIASSRFEEADRLLSAGIARKPDNFELRLQHAYSAHNSARYAEAVARWDDIRARWPDHAMAWSASASNRRELGRIDEAKDLIEQALARFPTDLIAVSEATRIFDRVGDPERSLALSDALMRLDPRQPLWRRNHLSRLIALARFEDAAALLDETSEADRTHAELAIGAVLIALRRADWAGAQRGLENYAPRGAEPTHHQAVRSAAFERALHQPEEARILWAHLIGIEPDDREALHHHAEALIRCGRYAEAGAAIERALESHLDDYHLLFDQALLARRTDRWDDAIDGFERLLRRQPSDEDARNFLAQARMDRAHALLEAGTVPSHAAERQDVGLVEDDDVRRLLLGFESLGQDCEFGLVQRRYGAEPLGLFRWNANDAGMLLKASDMTFEGMGDPANTLMGLWADYEYHLTDRRWGFAFHTWISRHEAERDALFAKMCRRIAFLRSKLLDDLASGDKIFVHKTHETEVELVRALLASLRQHGPVRLLWVRSLAALPNADQRGGTVDEIEPGLYAGYLSRFGNGPGVWQIPFEEWVRLCRAAVALRSGT